MIKIKDFMRREPTFCAALFAALLSCLAVRPDMEYIGYIDLRTLALLYCLMVVVAGLRRAGFFARLSHILCHKASSARGISVILILLCFFSAMLVTNDVALLTFVPFAVSVLVLAHQEDKLIWVVVLQTIAANLGSMLTPVGNPQNLYLYSRFDMEFMTFIKVTGPIWLLSLLFVCLLCIRVPKEAIAVDLGQMPILNKKILTVYSILFVVCLLVVLRIITWQMMLALVLLVLLVFDRKRLLDADFLLLATFICFFVFSGNLARIEIVNTYLRAALNGREMLVGAGVSQVISNVPAALLLSEFTDAPNQLLLGVNIGGLGTPVASLASLISLKLYSHADNASTGAFMKTFLVLNFALLAVLLSAAYILN